MYKNNSYNNREQLNQCIKLNWDNTEKLKIQVEKKKHRQEGRMEHEVGKVPCGCSDDSFPCGDDGWGHGWPEDSRFCMYSHGCHALVR